MKKEYSEILDLFTHQERKSQAIQLAQENGFMDWFNHQLCENIKIDMLEASLYFTEASAEISLPNQENAYQVIFDDYVCEVSCDATEENVREEVKEIYLEKAKSFEFIIKAKKTLPYFLLRHNTFNNNQQLLFVS